MSLPEWPTRPTEIANLLNPAFGGLLMTRAVSAFLGEQTDGMPFETAFLILPFCLHVPTAERLPTRPAVTPLHAWVQKEENRDVVLEFAERVKTLVPFSREAVVFAGQRGLVQFNALGNLISGTKALRGITKYKKSSDVGDVIHNAEVVGRWLALSGNSVTLFALLGVRP